MVLLPEPDQIHGVTRRYARPRSQPVGDVNDAGCWESFPCLEVCRRIAVIHDDDVFRERVERQWRLCRRDIGTENDLLIRPPFVDASGDLTMSDPELLADVGMNRLAFVALAFDVTVGLSQHDHLVTFVELLYHTLNKQVMHIGVREAEDVSPVMIPLALEQSEVFRMRLEILFAGRKLVPGMAAAGPEGFGIAAVASEIVVGDRPFRRPRAIRSRRPSRIQRQGRTPRKLQLKLVCLVLKAFVAFSTLSNRAVREEQTY